MRVTQSSKVIPGDIIVNQFTMLSKVILKSSLTGFIEGKVVLRQWKDLQVQPLCKGLTKWSRRREERNKKREKLKN